VLGTLTFQYQDHTIDLTPHWKRIAFLDATRAAVPDASIVGDRAKLLAYLDQKKIPAKPDAPLGKLQQALFEAAVEPTLIQPTFITDYPTEIRTLYLDVPREALGPEASEMLDHVRREVVGPTPYDTAARGAYALLEGPRFLVQIRNTGHCGFAILCAPLFCGAGCEPEALPLDQAHALALRYAVPFFLRYVGGRHRFARALLPDAAPGDVVVEEAHPRGGPR